MARTKILAKRAYDPPSKDDGLRVLVDRLLHQSSVCAGQGEYHRFLFFKMALQVALPEIPDVGADTVSGDAKLQTFLYSAANHKAMMMVVRKRR